MVCAQLVLGGSMPTVDLPSFHGRVVGDVLLDRGVELPYCPGQPLRVYVQPRRQFLYSVRLGHGHLRYVVLVPEQVL